MSADRKCPECGAVIPPGSTGGLCTQCLFSLGLDATNEPEATRPPPELAPLLAKAAPAIGVKFHYFGDYGLLEEIARGGMGVVFRARQISLNRTVALKLITAGHLASKDAVKRFHLEAEAAARLDHPNIVPIYEIGEHDGHHYFSMKLVEGGSLAQRLHGGGGRMRSREGAASVSASSGEERRSEEGRKTPGLTLRESVALLSSVSRAVHYAHQRGILHRDLKPGNILLDEDGEPHVTDFGLAKLIESDSTLTHSGMVMGTPSYMSPEQAEGKNNELTTASDLWSLGTILYELLTGQPAFRGGTPMDTLRQVMEQEPTKPSGLNLAVDPDLETITLKCLEKDPARRYASAAALADDLEHWLGHEPILARRAGVLERVVKWARRQPMLAAAVVLLLIVVIGGVAGISWHWREAVVARRAEAVERERAVRAEGDAVARLHEVKLNYVRANRLSGQPGQRFASLAELAQAASGTNRLALRNEAIACLLLPDLRSLKQWDKTPGWDSWKFDASLGRYATNDAIGNLTIRDAKSDAMLAQLPVQGAKGVDSLADFSPDGRFVATMDQGGQGRLWDGTTQSLRLLDLPAGTALLTFTPDSRALVVQHADGSIHFLNTTNGVDERAFPGPKKIPWIQFNSSGDKYLAVVGGKVIIIFRTSDGMHLRSLTGLNGAMWHPDGRRVVGAWLNNIGLWDVETGSQLAEFQGHESPVVGLAVTRTGEYLASASWDNSTRLWHIDTRREVLRLPDSGNSLSISTDDRRLSYLSWDHKQVRLYELPDMSACQRFILPPQTRRPTHHTTLPVFSPDDELVLTHDRDGIYIFHPPHAEPLALVPVGSENSVCLAPDGATLFTGGVHGAQRWPVNWSASRSELHLGPPEVLELTCGLPISEVSLSRDGGWLVARGKADALAFPAASPSKVVHFDREILRSYSPVISPDGRWVTTVAASRGQLQIWNGRTGALVTNLPTVGAWHPAFSPDGIWLACGQKDSTTVWKTGDWSLHQRIAHPVEPNDDLRHPLAFSPDGRVMAIFANAQQGIRFVRYETGEEFVTLPAGRATSSLCFSPAGDRLAVANESGYLQIWDLRRVREQLASLNLDWDMPPYPEWKPALTSHPVRVIVHTNAPPQ